MVAIKTSDKAHEKQHEIRLPDSVGRIRPIHVRATMALSPKEVYAAEDARDELKEFLGDDSRRSCPDKGPCPWVSCRYHLAIDVSAAGMMSVYRPGPWPNADRWDSVAQAVVESGDEDAPTANCAIKLASAGVTSADGVADMMGISVEHVSRIEAAALRKLAVKRPDLAELIGDGEYEASWC